MTHNSLFSDVPIDEDTRIIEQKATTLGEFDALYQKWCWEGVIGESLIFITEQVQGLSDEALELKAIEAEMDFDREVTISRGEKFTFVNFNFEATY